MALSKMEAMEAQLASLKAENERLQALNAAAAAGKRDATFTQCKGKVVNGREVANDYFTAIFLGGSARASLFIEAWEYLASVEGNAWLKGKVEGARASGKLPSDADRALLRAQRKVEAKARFGKVA